MATYENPWLYKGQEVESDQIQDMEGFVYLLTNIESGQKYIGKKNFWSRKKDRKSKRRKTKESDWKTYYSSSETIKNDVKINGGWWWTREILYICPNKLCMSFHETREQFIRNVLFDDSYCNDTIMGKYYRAKKDYYLEAQTFSQEPSKAPLA